MEKIKIRGRGCIHTLEKLNEKEYKLHPEYPDALRTGLQQDNKSIAFIDPAGGPMMYVGSELPGVPKAIIESIRFDNGPIITVL